MPKGVEHTIDSFDAPVVVDVINSVMPKGVEHTIWNRLVLESSEVINSVMPKGVEHRIRLFLRMALNL